MDGAGELALTFPPPRVDARVDWREAQRHANQRRMDDMGFGYAVKRVDAAGAHPSLTVIYNRRFASVYRV